MINYSSVGWLLVTRNIRVRFAAGNPLSALKPPVGRIRQNHIHNNIINARRDKTRNSKTQKRKHPAAGKWTEKNKSLFQK